jgi:hypothetical protein
MSRVIKEAKRQHYYRLIEKADNKIKTALTVIKHESGKLQQMEQIPPVLINNEKVNGPQKIADAFNTFFLKITENLDLYQETRGDALIHSLKRKHSTGCDGITSKILKVCASLISRPLTHICNHSLLMGTFPNHLKISLHKNGDKTNMSNYRAISLLTTFCKVNENVMHNRKSHYLNANNILVSEQFDFRKGIAIENAVFKLTDCILKSINQKMHVGEIPLYNPKYLLKLGNNRAWNPTGAVLGHLLFVRYVSDLPLTINTLAASIIFADDTSVIISSKNLYGFCMLSNMMGKWFAAIKLTLNLDKPDIIKFVRYNSPQFPISIEYDDKYIEESVHTKFLGLQIDSHLNWKTHVDQLVPKLNRACYAITSLSYQQHRHPEINLFCLFSLFNDIQNNLLGKFIKQQESIYITEENC